MGEFLKWLAGALGIATGVFCAVAFVPDTWIVPQKLVIGFGVVLLSTLCYTVLLTAIFGGSTR